MTSCDKGVPSRCSNALVVIPLVNANINPPSYTAPVVINAAITLKPGSFLGQLNAFDYDGDKITYSLSSSNEQNVLNAIDVRADGRLFLSPTQDLRIFPEGTFTVIVNLRDDGSCCGNFISSLYSPLSLYSSLFLPQVPQVPSTSSMNVIIKIVEVNMFSPTFITNDQDNKNYCENTFKANENTIFTIEVFNSNEFKIKILNSSISRYKL